jgi:leucine dehydrogenase
VTNALDLAAELGHERVLVIQRPEVGLRAVVAIHDSTLGPAVGGTRLRAYPSFDAAVVDALGLSRAMTYKAAYAGMALGGAKAVIDADPSRKSPALLEAYARAVAEIQDRFVTGADLGIDLDDVRFMARFSRAFEHAPSGAGPDAADLTALGVFAALRTVAARLGTPWRELRVAVQGLGEVGRRLARRLAAAGARLVLTDVVPARARDLARELGAEQVGPDAVYEVPCDVFSPNAAGGVLDETTAPRLRCRAVCGAANNPLVSGYVGYDLAARGILYAPDFVVSAGGILSILFERGELDEAGIVARVERLGADLAELLDAAAAEGLPPFKLAERRVDEKLAAARP